MLDMTPCLCHGVSPVEDQVLVQMLQREQQWQDDLRRHILLLHHTSTADELLEQVALVQRTAGDLQLLGDNEQSLEPKQQQLLPCVTTAKVLCASNWSKGV